MSMRCQCASKKKHGKSTLHSEKSELVAFIFQGLKSYTEEKVTEAGKDSKYVYLCDFSDAFF